MIALMNQRGVYSFSHGVQERELARGYREKAEELELSGFVRFAATIRKTKATEQAAVTVGT